MSSILVLARGDSRNYRDLAGRSIFSGLTPKVLLFVHRGNVDKFRELARELGSDVEIHIVRWNDPQGVVTAAASVAKNQKLLAVATLDEELVDLAAEIRAHLGVRGLQPKDAAHFRDKVAMKRAVAAAGVTIPQFEPCTNRAAVASMLTKYGKLVVKPVRGMGARGIAFITTAMELEAWYAACSQVGEFEAEQFIDGVLYHVNAVVHDGQALLTASAPYFPGMGNIDFGAGAPFATVIEDDPARCVALKAFSDRVVSALNVVSGVTHLECFVTPSGEIVFCEIAIRPGGGGIVSMIEAQHGVNFNRVALRLEAGQVDVLSALSATPMLHPGVAGLVGFRSAFSGFVHEAASAKDFPEPWIHVCAMNVGGGSFKAASAHCTDFWGSLVFSSKDQTEFSDRVAELGKRFADALRTQAA
jgi:biotin carboxylase